MANEDFSPEIETGVERWRKEIKNDIEDVFRILRKYGYDLYCYIPEDEEVDCEFVIKDQITHLKFNLWAWQDMLREVMALVAKCDFHPCKKVIPNPLEQD